MHQTRTIRQLSCGIVAASLACLAAGLALAQPQGTAPEPASPRQEKRLVTAERSMVATANPLATEVGNAVLAQGGSAVDAAVALQLMLNLVEPQSSGIGGGAFMVHWDAKSHTLTTLDGRETAPLAAGPDLFLQPDGTPMRFLDAVIGGRSVGVPGTLKLLEEAHRRWGRLPWADLLAPTIALAEAGFPVSARLHQVIAETKDSGLDRFEPTRSYFLEPDGSPKAVGTVLHNPDLARTLRLIATEGSAPFYEGEIAQDIVRTVTTATNPGQMSLDDLRRYEVKERPPVCIRYRAYEVCGMGPPSSGGIAVAQILGILAPFDMAAAGPSADGVHLFLEASRLAYADRDLYVADADFGRVPVKGLVDPLYLAQRAELIRPNATLGKAPAGTPSFRETRLLAPHTSFEAPGTSHFVILDAEGNGVSMTTTIESGFGSRLMVRGFLLNNELTDFNFEPVVGGRPVANRVEGGKRPRSSMAPTIVFERERRPFMLVGSPGGARIIDYVAKSIVGVLDWGMDIQTAVALGNIVNRNGDTELEAGTAMATLQPALEARGHVVKLRDQESGLHGIVVRDGRLEGGADPRREGSVLGR